MVDFPSIADHILIWIFGIVFPFLSGLQSEKLNGQIILNEASRKRLYLGNSLMLAVSGSSVLIIWLFKKRSFDYLGFNEPIQFSVPLIIVLTVFIGNYLIEIFLTLQETKKQSAKNEKEWFDKSSFLPKHKKELPAYILLCLCAGIFEEIIYRGFMVTYFLPLKETSSIPFLALLAPSILFSLAHYYQGWSSVAKIFIFSTLLSWIFISTKSIYLNIAIHFLIDLISGIAMMNKRNK